MINNPGNERKRNKRRMLWTGIIGLELMILGAQGMYLFLSPKVSEEPRTEQIQDVAELERLMQDYVESDRSVPAGISLVRALYKQGHLREAEKYLAQLLERKNLTEAEKREIRTLQAMVKLERGDEEGALDALLLARGISPDDLTSRELKSRLKKEGLTELLRNTLRGDASGLQRELDQSHYPVIQLKRGGAESDSDPAIEALLHEIQKNGRSLKKMMELADLYERSARNGQAVRVLEEILQNETKMGSEEKALLHRRIGLLKLESGDSQGAFLALLNAAGIDPKSDVALGLRKKFEKEGFERSVKKFLTGKLPVESEEGRRDSGSIASGKDASGGGSDDITDAKSSTEMGNAPEDADARETEKKAKVTALKKEGIELFRQKRFSEAAASFQKAADLFPDDPEIRYMMGRSLASENRLSEAEAELAKAIRLNPNNARFHFHNGLIQFRKKRYAKAAESFETATILDPQFYEAFFNLGVSQEKLAKKQEAAIAYGVTVEGDPGLWQAALNLAIIHKNTNEGKMALDVLASAIQHNPGQAPLYYQKGEILSSQGKVQDSIVALQKSVELDPDLYEGWFNLGVNLGRLNRYEEAISTLERASNLRPSDPAPHYETGRLLAKSGKEELAIEILEKTLLQSPGHRNASIELVPLYLKKGFQTEARSVLQTAITKHPKDYELRFNQGNLLRKLKDYEQASNSYEQAIQLKPDRQDSYLNLAELHREFGEPMRAVAVYERLLAKAGENVNARREAGLLLYKNDETRQKAKPHLEIYLARNPGAPDAAKIRAMLDSLQ